MNRWTCTVPGCLGCGSGYGSERAARAAARRHDDDYRAYHRTLNTRRQEVSQ